MKSESHRHCGTACLLLSSRSGTTGNLIFRPATTDYYAARRKDRNLGWGEGWMDPGAGRQADRVRSDGWKVCPAGRKAGDKETGEAIVLAALLNIKLTSVPSHFQLRTCREICPEKSGRVCLEICRAISPLISSNISPNELLLKEDKQGGALFVCFQCINKVKFECLRGAILSTAWGQERKRKGDGGLYGEVEIY